ncbi:hypothetical protein CONLIGDRAFT_634691 [Coniochaeta ligniaria NRRL 30616]|uniref:Uncharacterized protein n=1 Tax=Coniochaeta ligniaria NRRL 30616 TaxID=1408157 RepID=A0A1J7IG23_9PEZI|nr:hypothetical protein CONLIGDRAFT_634691 [Coniochaeta ligniaria NRRL 30616]
MASTPELPMPYQSLFPDPKVLADKFLAAEFSFARGLLNRILAPLPPTPEYFETLPRPQPMRWSVYLLKYEKDGHSPRVYIGSGTNQYNGVADRVRDYTNDYGTDLSSRIKATIREGFALSPVGLLCWTRLPPGSLVVETRGLL